MRKLFLIIMTLVACSWAAMAQVTYRGTVVDAENNEPLMGATIMPIGGGEGTSADIDGKYSISVPKNVTTARVSYVGYQEQVVKLTNNMTIKLVSTEQNLDDVVIVAYGTANKESLTGSVAVVGSKEIEDRPVTSVTAALEGNAPGVQVNNSVGYPGSSPSILIRGYNTINGATSAPLVVVDGIVYSGSISDLNPADVESMSVLKDAASSALYGNRGANGVILITTKKAKQAGKVEVTLEMRQGMYNRGLPFYDRMDTNQWMQTQFDAYVNGRLSQLGGDRQDAVNHYREQFFTLAYSNVYGKPATELFNEEGKFVGSNPLPGYDDLDWWKAVSRNGHRQEYTVNAAAATDKFNVFASAGYLKENGYMLQTDFERFNGRMNANFQPTSYFKMGLNLAAMHTSSDLGITSKENEGLTSNPFLVMDIAPNIPYYQHNSETGEILRDEQGAPLWNVSQYLGNQGTNVAYSMRLDKKKLDATVVDASIYGTAIIPYGFELTFRGNIHRDKTNSWSYMNNINGSGVQPNGRLYQNFGTYKDHTFMQTLTWNHQYGDHNVDLLLDHENYQYSQDVSSVDVENQVFPGVYALSNFSSTNPATEAIVQLRSESYLGRARYNYDQRYFGEFSLRSDGSSYFEKAHRWGTFWSVGASWIISKEKFMDPARGWLDYLKFRAAYGAVGNDANAGAYAYYNLYDMITYGDVLTSLIPASIASQNLKWEATRTFDAALEGALFNDRFTFSIGYFNKRNTDLIFGVTQAASVGSIYDTATAIKILKNIGTMQNIGWELSFGVDIIRNADFRWNFTLDATLQRNKIIKLPDGHDLPGQSLFIGKSMGTLYM
ncbi:MAG: SusC/RagA family TonB-linked outer membrane protein, partial [Muribaculaceae bacterium]|nr:SusC/RagA family TonB-linked outer membrane protein [Muribaculaceae bacterium]